MNVDKPVELRSEDKKGADIIAGQHENKGHKDIKSTGKSEAQEKDLDYGKSCDSTSKKVDLCGMKVPESYLETKDWNCVLHINTKLSKEQQSMIANMFVEFANIGSVDQLKQDGLPSWPLKDQWFQAGHVPLTEKRTFAFRALVELFLHFTSHCDSLSGESNIGSLEFVDLMSSFKIAHIKSLDKGEEIKSEDFDKTSQKSGSSKKKDTDVGSQQKMKDTGKSSDKSSSQKSSTTKKKDTDEDVGSQQMKDLSVGDNKDNVDMKDIVEARKELTEEKKDEHTSKTTEEICQKRDL